MNDWIWLPSLGVIILAIVAVMRQLEVRLVLLVASVAVASIGGRPEVVLHTFFSTLADEKFIVPICCAMGFAHVLKQTGCDQHLIHLLTGSLQKFRWVLIPGGVLIGFTVNIPIISQSSTALALGTVLVPLLQRAGLPMVTVGAVLLLGSSIGGELLNPGAPELNTIARELKIGSRDCIRTLMPFLMIHVVAATVVLWWRQRRSLNAGEAANNDQEAAFKVNLIKAAIPILPLILLFLSGPPLNWVHIPEDWLVQPGKQGYEARLIGAAMIVGIIAAALSDRASIRQTATTFFQGAGYAYTHIISLIVVASCFGQAIEVSGLTAILKSLIVQFPGLLIPLATLIPLGFAFISGSGMAATQSLYPFFVEPARLLGVDPIAIGGLVSIGSAAGRTMSPIAAVTLMSSTLVQCKPAELSRRVAGPLLAGIGVVMVYAMLTIAHDAGPLESASTHQTLTAPMPSQLTFRNQTEAPSYGFKSLFSR